MLRTHIFAAALIAGVLAPAWTSAAAGPSLPVKIDGGMLVGTSGMTLYTFDKDTAGSGKSACNGPCADNWPPLKAGATDRVEGDYSVVTRDDGSKQWAYKGQPLYFWTKDAKPGDTSGDGVKGVWHTAKP
jgi:predicted lipoprotein with Yx(FWY)xxD motif